MVSTASLAEVAALVGDPARAGMLTALMDGRALTATELAQVAGVAPTERHPWPARPSCLPAPCPR